MCVCINTVRVKVYVCINTVCKSVCVLFVCEHVRMCACIHLCGIHAVNELRYFDCTKSKNQSLL